MAASRFVVLVLIQVSLCAAENIVAVNDFFGAKTLADLQEDVAMQYEAASGLRCRPGSCVLPRTDVRADLASSLRKALLTVSKGNKVEVVGEHTKSMFDGGARAFLPTLRTHGEVQSAPDFHDDADGEEPRKAATWTAMLYLHAGEGDRFVVREKSGARGVQERALQPGTLILFDSSKVEHAAVGVNGRSRWAIGPIALDNLEDLLRERPMRARILQWGGGGTGNPAPAPAPPRRRAPAPTPQTPTRRRSASSAKVEASASGSTSTASAFGLLTFGVLLTLFLGFPPKLKRQ